MFMYRLEYPFWNSEESRVRELRPGDSLIVQACSDSLGRHQIGLHDQHAHASIMPGHT